MYGTDSSISDAATTRPRSASGVRRGTCVYHATIAPARQAPNSAEATRAVTVVGTANRNMPAAPATVAAVIAKISPRAAIRRGAVSPAAIAPAPWQADSTPRNALERPRPFVTTAN